MGHAGIINHSCLIYQYQNQNLCNKFKKKGMDRKQNNKHMTAILVPYCSMLLIPLTSYQFLAAKQESEKSLALNENILKNLQEKSQENGMLTEKGKDRATRCSRRTRGHSQMKSNGTALRVQIGGRHQTSPASLRGGINDSNVLP